MEEDSLTLDIGSTVRDKVISNILPQIDPVMHGLRIRYHSGEKDCLHVLCVLPLNPFYFTIFFT